MERCCITRTPPPSVLQRTSLAAKLARIRSIRDPGKGVPRVAKDAMPSMVAPAGGACRVAARAVLTSGDSMGAMPLRRPVRL
jgi:hypothetical protein